MPGYAMFILHGLAILASTDSTSSAPNRSDWQYKNACGPISLWAACRAQGGGLSLDETCKRCRFDKGELCSIGAIRDAVSDSWLLTVHGAKLNPKELKDTLQRGESVVLFVRGKESQTVDHAICALGFEHDRYFVVDYPVVARTITQAEMLEIWDGQAVVVRRSLLGYLWAYANECICAALVIALCFVVFRRRRNYRYQLVLANNAMRLR